jgi:hypothetical protein
VIIPMRWCDAPGGVRVILPTGRTVYLLDRSPGLPSLAMLRDGRGRTAALRVDPGAVVPVVFEECEAAVIALKTAFGQVEFLREVTP